MKIGGGNANPSAVYILRSMPKFLCGHHLQF
ncbi:hypothetical protein BRADI_4g41246v3 [Brachypodium distachyon]|uniref:Uncharacterized protein n=1 Tax=Brachypodium distachyon TaxID=15368 RepID=A0A2K2CTK5_BRADI|nr:hypothetical protein BRADI_4g41246v3 [Brachypodium distachyon]